LGQAMPPVGREIHLPVQPAAATSSMSDALPTMPAVVGSDAVTSMQRAAATPVPPVSPSATPLASEAARPIQRAVSSPLIETESVTPTPFVTASPVPDVSSPASPVSGTATVMPVQRAAATLVPTASSDVFPVTQSEQVAPVQRAAGLSETDMPTMIMPVPVVASQSISASSAEAAFSPMVLGTNQGVEPAVQRLAEPVSPTVTSHSPEISPPIQSPASPSTERLALEDVWPVQRKETSGDKTADLPLDPVEVAESVRHEKPEAAQIQQVMRQVAAAKTSDSSVELILPRRQRPQVSTRPAPAIQTQPAAPVVKGSNGNNGQGDGPSRATQAYVPTEIGPLPGDLWEILGAPLPRPMGPTGETGSPALMRTAAAAAPTMPFAEPATRYPGSAPTTGTNGHPAPVQREPAPATGQQSQPSSVATVQSGMPTRTASAQEGGEQGAEAGEQGEVNVEELARQVYSEVKRRIAVDWERGRGRF